MEKIFQEEELLGQSFAKERNDMIRKLRLLTCDLKWEITGGKEKEKVRMRKRSEKRGEERVNGGE